MFVGKVSNKVVATIKNPKLEGLRFVEVNRLSKSNKVTGNPIVAVDNIGCGNDDIVLVVSGAGARHAVGNSNLPIDAAVIGLVDSYSK